MTTTVTFQIQVQDIDNAQFQQSTSDITVEVSIRKVKQLCPYSLMELVHLYKIAFPNGRVSYDEYIASPFYQKYILRKDGID